MSPLDKAAVAPGPVAASAAARSRWLTEALPVLAFGLLFQAALGIRNGAGNQALYLLDGMHRADPSFLARDWYTTGAFKYHAVWQWIVAELYGAGLLEIGLAVGTVAMTLTLTTALYLAMRRLYEAPLVPWCLTLLLFAAVFTRGLGDFYLLPNSVEPFGIAGVAFVAAAAFLAWGWPLGVGVCLGVSAMMHANFAILNTGVLILLSVAMIGRWNRRALLLVWVPFLLLASRALADVLGAASAGGAEEVHRILRDTAPQHYQPLAHDWRALALFAGTLLFGAGGLMLRRPERAADMARLAAVLTLVVVGGLAAGLLEPFWFVNRLLPWRLSPILMLFGLAAGSAALAAMHGARWPAGGTAGVVMLLGGLGLLALGGTPRMWFALAVAVIPLALAAVGRPAGAVVALALAVVGMAPMAAAEAGRSHIALWSTAGERAPLYRWVRANTPVDGIFLVPPEWRDFRLNAERALIVDHWGMPAYAGDVAEWWKRMRDVTGMERPDGLPRQSAAFAALDCPRLRTLSERYGLGFAIVPRGQRLDCARTIHEDTAYAVLCLPMERTSC